MDPVSLIVGAVVLTVGLLVGRAIGVNSKPKPIIEPEPNLRCGCHHELSSHDPETNRCHEMEDVIVSRNTSSYTNKYKQVQCICRQYTGDRPLTNYYAPRILE